MSGARPDGPRRIFGWRSTTLLSVEHILDANFDAVGYLESKLDAYASAEGLEPVATVYRHRADDQGLGFLRIERRYRYRIDGGETPCQT